MELETEYMRQPKIFPYKHSTVGLSAARFREGSNIVRLYISSGYEGGALFFRDEIQIRDADIANLVDKFNMLEGGEKHEAVDQASYDTSNEITVIGTAILGMLEAARPDCLEDIVRTHPRIQVEIATGLYKNEEE